MNVSSPVPIETVREYWDKHVEDWKIATHAPGSREFFAETEAYRFEKLHYLNECIPFADFPAQRVLEVGSGLGNDLSRFARQGAEVTGIDLSARAVDLARENFAQRGLSGEFLQMNGECMDFPDASFDAVYCHTVLQFTPAPDAMIGEIHRVLKPGGLAILMGLNSRSWLMLLHRLMKTKIDYLDAPVYRMFNIAEFQDMLRAFDKARVITERFPVATRVHKGLKARLYNLLFVDLFNALPKRLTSASGHHLLAYAHKGQ